MKINAYKIGLLIIPLAIVSVNSVQAKTSNVAVYNSTGKMLFCKSRSGIGMGNGTYQNFTGFPACSTSTNKCVYHDRKYCNIRLKKINCSLNRRTSKNLYYTCCIYGNNSHKVDNDTANKKNWKCNGMPLDNFKRTGASWVFE